MAVSVLSVIVFSFAPKTAGAALEDEARPQGTVDVLGELGVASDVRGRERAQRDGLPAVASDPLQRRSDEQSAESLALVRLGDLRVGEARAVSRGSIVEPSDQVVAGTQLEAAARRLVGHRHRRSEVARHGALPERERVGLGARLEERDLHRPVADGVVLADELVHPPAVEEAVAVLVDVHAG
jgi:hypothetical protein